MHRVSENHFEAASLAMQLCLQRGYRRVGFVFTEINDSPLVSAPWLGAYLRHQLAYPAEDRIPVCPGHPPDAGVFREWFEHTRPDALLVTSMAGVEISRWLADLGKKVPEEVGLVELQHNPGYRTSGVYHDAAKIGAHAVEILVSLINGNVTGVPTAPHEVLLAGEWRETASLPTRLA